MEWSSIAVMTANFILIAALPFVFFRRDGQFTRMWCLTALPYGIALVFLARAPFAGVEPIAPIDADIHRLMQAAGSLLSCVSIALIAMTIGTHRIPLALWHQKRDKDTPACIVTWGSYKYIRHPFYTAFLLAWGASVLVAPAGLMIGLAGYASALLLYTARKEERRLLSEQGPLGIEYRHYIQRTGRFFPRLFPAAYSSGPEDSR